MRYKSVTSCHSAGSALDSRLHSSSVHLRSWGFGAALWRTLWKWCPRAPDGHYSAADAAEETFSAAVDVACCTVATPNWSKLVDTMAERKMRPTGPGHSNCPSVYLAMGRSTSTSASIFHVWHGRNSIACCSENRTPAAPNSWHRRLTCATPISYTISHKNAKFMQLLQMPSVLHAPPHGVQRSETGDLRPETRPQRIYPHTHRVRRALHWSALHTPF